MNKFITSRYYLHLIIGLAIGYNATSLTDFNKYVWYKQIAGVVAITFICFWFGVFWEWLQSKFFEARTDWNDIFWSAGGGFIGSVLCFIFWNNNYIFYSNICLIAIFVGKDVIRHFKK